MQGNGGIDITSPTFHRAAFLETRYFPGLDALRGIAILLVLFHHSSIKSAILSPLHANCRFGVHFFFVISGFIIATQLLRATPLTRKDLGHFWMRRFLRLAPLYYLALVLETVLVFGFKVYSDENRALFQAKLPAYLFYFSNWHPAATKGPFFQAWSLAVEEQFYLVFGLTVFLVPPAIWIRICAMALIAKIVLFSSGLIPWTAPWWRILFSYQESILLGVLLAYLLQTKVFFEFARFLTNSRHAVQLLSLFAALLLCVAVIPHSSRADALTLYVLFSVITLASIFTPHLPTFRSKPLIFIGRISYGIYLFHMLFVNFGKRMLPDSPWLAFIVSTTLVILFAALLNRLIERPIQTFYKTRFSHGRSLSAPV